jgi:hypothetical protein
MAQSGEKGHASAKGWWTGVPANQKLEFSHFILLPVSATILRLTDRWLAYMSGTRKPDALSFTRVRLLEVEYTIRVSLSAGSLGADVHVILPIRILNFLSIDPPPIPPLGSPVAASGRYFMRKSDLHRNQTSNSTIREHRPLMDGGFAGAPYSDYDSEATPRLNNCSSDRSVSVYDDSSSMDEKPVYLPPQRPLVADRDSDIDAFGRSKHGSCSGPNRNFDNLLTILGQSSNTHPQNAPFSFGTEAHTQPLFTPFELRVQQKMHALTTSTGKPDPQTDGLAPIDTLPHYVDNRNKSHHTDKLLKPPNVFWKTPDTVPGFSLVPSHKLPKPPRLITRPMVKTHLTDPGPMPIAVPPATSDSPAAILSLFRTKSDATPDTQSTRLNRMRSQTESSSRPPLPSPVRSGFSAVKAKIADMEDKVLELHHRADGVVPFI